jgi:hypothetical protein
MRENIARAPRAYGRFWTGVFKDAVREGFIRSDLDPRLTRLLLVGSISWMADWYNPNGPSSPEEIAEAVLRLFLEGAAVDRKQLAARLGAPPGQPRTRRKMANRPAAD